VKQPRTLFLTKSVAQHCRTVGRIIPGAGGLLWPAARLSEVGGRTGRRRWSVSGPNERTASVDCVRSS